MLAEGFDTDRLLHGGAVPYTAADGLVVLEPAADPDGLTGAVAAAARAENMPVAELAAPDSGLAPLLAQIPMTVRLQLLAENFARLRHQNPDAAIVGAWDEPELWRMGSPTPQ
jgi:glucosamine--fructose-6-phosphate aminotransferase (isomerizing)